MNRIISSMKIDIKTMKMLLLGPIIMFSILIISSFLNGSGANYFLITGGIIIGASFCSMIFIKNDKSNINKLYSILPIKPRDVIIGRHLLVILADVVLTLVSIGLTLLISNIMQKPITIFEITVMTLVALIISAIIITIEFPILFKFKFSKINFIIFIPSMLVLMLSSAIGEIIAKNKDIMQFINNTMVFIQNNIGLSWVIGVCIVILILSLSCIISIAISKSFKS